MAVVQKKEELASEMIENGEEDELDVDDGENKDPAKKKKKKKKKKKAGEHFNLRTQNQIYCLQLIFLMIISFLT